MEPFFDFAHERHRIYLSRQAGKPWPWSEDPILSRYRFTNVYRELDATTVWFRQNVRGPLRDRPEVLLATVLFRWFNRMTSGEAIFMQKTGDSRGAVRTPWEHLLVERDEGLREIEWSLRRFCGDGPYTTGAYIIKTPDGMDKVRGVLQCVRWFMEQSHQFSSTTNVNWTTLAERMTEFPLSDEHTLENTWAWLRRFPFLGDFMAYEVVTDLRHTALLERAPDIRTWANPGPGAMRGLNRIHGRPVKHNQPKHVFVCEMRDLLAHAERSAVWPANPTGDPVEMRDIEHTLCEFDKYERVRTGEGTPRGVFRA